MQREGYWVFASVDSFSSSASSSLSSRPGGRKMVGAVGVAFMGGGEKAEVGKWGSSSAG